MRQVFVFLLINSACPISFLLLNHEHWPLRLQSSWCSDLISDLLFERSICSLCAFRIEPCWKGHLCSMILHLWIMTLCGLLESSSLRNVSNSFWTERCLFPIYSWISLGMMCCYWRYFSLLHVIRWVPFKLLTSWVAGCNQAWGVATVTELSVVVLLLLYIVLGWLG